jgi:hypothetical protein
MQVSPSAAPEASDKAVSPRLWAARNKGGQGEGDMTLKIEAGKFYRTRDGRKVGPMVKDGYYNGGFPWMYDIGAGWWSDDGQRKSRRMRETHDIIAEWTDAPDVDLTKITTPFGLLPKETQDALKAHGGPYEIWGGTYWAESADPNWDGWYCYRVKPAPKVETVTIGGFNWNCEWHFRSNKDARQEYGITFNLIDGEPDCASIRMVKL